MRDLPIILFGAGGVGRALLRQIVEQRDLHARQYGLQLCVLAVCDSSGAILEVGQGLEDELLTQIITYKAEGHPLSAHLAGGPQSDPVGIVDIAGRDGAVVVDCTASTATADALLFALDRRYAVVLANKKPLTMDQEVYDRLTAAGATDYTDPPLHLGRVRWETTVGAALPIIATQKRLVSSGDTVKRIAGAFSGTLGYVMSGLQAGQPFSDVVRQAHRLGYTEPDPRDDLSGMDVARKALILARGLGWRMNMDQVAVEGLYPAELGELSVDAFLDALPQLDDGFRERVDAAAAEGCVLRYAATVEGGRCSAGPVVVPATGPLGRLTGSDNLAEFTTRWYDSNPLVIQGRGAGTDATASGVLGDIIEMAYTV